MNIREKHIKDIPVYYVASKKGFDGARQAFAELEDIVGLSGKKFYALVRFGDAGPDYRACVAIDDTTTHDLPQDSIPAGTYATIKIDDWAEKIDMIHQCFKAMSDKYTADPSRPEVEYYRSEKELICMMPILK